MPRPQKAKLDYFPLDTDIDQDDKIALIEAKHGIVGFGVIIKLFKKIYATNGYYYEWNEKTQLLFSKAIGVDFEKVIEIVNDALNWKLFDRGLYKKYGILTSNRIQKTYLEATIRRKEVELIREYLLEGINGYIKRDNVVIYAMNTGNNKQSKVKESKVKESKVKESKVSNSSDLENKSEQINFNFKTRKWEGITEEDISDWAEAYPACDVRQEIKRMKVWLLANPRKRKKNYRRFIANWLTRTQDSGGTKNFKKEDYGKKYKKG